MANRRNRSCPPTSWNPGVAPSRAPELAESPTARTYMSTCDRIMRRAEALAKGIFSRVKPAAKAGGKHDPGSGRDDSMSYGPRSEPSCRCGTGGPRPQDSYSKQGGGRWRGGLSLQRPGRRSRWGPPENVVCDQLTPAAQTHICVTSSAWDFR